MSKTDFDAIICRTNAGVLDRAIEQTNAGAVVKVTITGGFGSLRKWAEAADRLMDGLSTDHSELAAFKNWESVQAHSKTDEGADLRMMVRLIDNYGTQAIYNVCDTCIDGDSKTGKNKLADVTVVTAHKSKGLEWDRVLINGDFSPPKDNEDGTPGKPSDQDLRLIYVACTRSRLHLDASAVAWALA
jgi:superfamily I DNA/RNA helicase